MNTKQSLDERIQKAAQEELDVFRNYNSEQDLNAVLGRILVGVIVERYYVATIIKRLEGVAKLLLLLLLPIYALLIWLLIQR